MNEQIPNAAERFADEHQQEQRELLVGSVRYRVSCRAAETHPSQQRGQQGNPLRSFHCVFPPLCAFLLCTVWHKPGGLGTLHPLAGRRTCPLHGRFLNIFGESEKFLENAVTFCRPVHITLQKPRRTGTTEWCVRCH